MTVCAGCLKIDECTHTVRACAAQHALAGLAMRIGTNGNATVIQPILPTPKPKKIIRTDIVRDAIVDSGGDWFTISQLAGSVSVPHECAYRVCLRLEKRGICESRRRKKIGFGGPKEYRYLGAA